MQKANDTSLSLRQIADGLTEMEAGMRFFGLKTCDTCRKALKAIRVAGLEVEVIDVRADGVAAADRRAMVAAFGEKAINRASATWRGLSEAERAAPVADLIAAHPTLIKRPVIDRAGVWTQGWSAPVAESVLGPNA